jgi:hypothetical protein
MLVELFLQTGLLSQQRVVIGVGLGKLVVDGVERRQEIDDLLDAFFYDLADGLRGIELRLLFEQPDRVAL